MASNQNLYRAEVEKGLNSQKNGANYIKLLKQNPGRIQPSQKILLTTNREGKFLEKFL